MKRLLMASIWLIHAGRILAADGTLVPISSELTFSPNGFDDNDQIQVVIEGRLPNDCYRLEQADIKTNPQSKEILIQSRCIS